MAVYQATGIPAISLPNGASSLPVQTIHLLERFEEIILWMDNDVAGQTAAQKFAKKLGVRRCKVVQEMKDEWGPEGGEEFFLLLYNFFFFSFTQYLVFFQNLTKQNPFCSL